MIFANMENRIVMKTETIITIVAVAMLLSCRKETEVVPRLHLDTTVVTSDISGGDKTVSVTASGPWTAEFTEEVDWVSADCRNTDGNGSILLHFEPNVGEFRFVYLKVQLSGTDLYKMVSVNQEAVAGSPIVKLTPPQDYFPSEGGSFGIAYFSNREPDDLKIELEPEVDWLQDIAIGADRISFRLVGNEEQSRRSTVLWLVHEDAAGNRFKDKCTVTQKAKEVSQDEEMGGGNEDYVVDSDEVNWI